jgi:hypothetical protein
LTRRAAALALALAAGCPKAPPPERPPPAPAAARAPDAPPGAPAPPALHPPPPAAEAALAGAPARLVLHDAGAAPRVRLGALPTPAGTWGVAHRSETTLQSSLAGLDSPPVAVPARTVHAALSGPAPGAPAHTRRLVVRAVDEGGAAGAPPPAKAPRHALEGAELTLQPVPGGGWSVADAPAPGPAAALLDALLSPAGILGVPLPDSPVGNGARWEHWSRATQGGLPVVQRLGVQLTVEPGGARTLQVHATRWVDAPGPVPLPDPPGATLVGFSSDGTGRVLLVDGEAAPLAAFEDEVQLALRVADPSLGAPAAVAVRVHMRVEVVPEPPRPAAP